MIKLNDITFGYSKTLVVSNLSLEFQSDKINCLVGPSGCGKTTLLNLLAGSVQPSKGEIFGLPTQLSYIFQDTRIIPWLTVYENVVFPLKGKQEKSYIHDKAKKFLNHVNLWDYRNAFPRELSGGMKQRVSIARAFAYPSSLILMDEAFQGLDIMLKEKLLDDFVASWTDEPRTVVFVTHDLEEALLMGQNIIVLPVAPISTSHEIQIKHPPGSHRPDLMNIKKEIRALMAQ